MGSWSRFFRGGVFAACIFAAATVRAQTDEPVEETEAAQPAPEPVMADPGVREKGGEDPDQPRTYHKQPGDDDLILDMQDSLERDLSEKHDLDIRDRETRKRLHLPPNSPGSRLPEEPPIVEQMEDLHSELSDDIVQIADNIDQLFGNNETSSYNHTNIRLANSFIFLEGEKFKNDPEFKLRLKLPQLQEKLALEFDDDFEQEDVSYESYRTQQILNQRRRASRGGLAYYEQLLKGIESKLSGGLEYKHQVIAYGSFRLMKNFVLSSNQKITAVHEYFDDTIKRRGQTMILNYDYSFGKNRVFRIANEETYRDEFNTFETWHGVSFFHQLDDKNYLSYDYRVKSVNPAERHNFFLEMHIADVVYRHLLYRKHLYGEIGPAVFFPKEKDYNTQLGLTLKIELIVGNI